MSDPEPSGPFSNWDDPTWDRPVQLMEAIKLWSPEFGSRLCELLDEAGEVSGDEIRRTAEQRRQREAGADGAVNATPDADGGPSNRESPASLRDDFLRLPRQWRHLNQTDRLAVATELAGRLIIAKTMHGGSFLLAYRPSAPGGDSGVGCVQVDDADHLMLGPFDFDLRNSTIRGPEQNWLSVWVLGGGAAEGQRMRVTRLAREKKDSAAASAWALERKKAMRDRQFFRFDELADELAWNPQLLKVETAKRSLILSDLERWIRRGQFDLIGDSEVVTQTSEPPYFVPLASLSPDEILIDPEGLVLRRTACQRYLLNSALERAPRLLRDWFPEAAGAYGKAAPSTSAPSGEPASPHAPRKRGRKPTKRQAVAAKMRSEIEANSITRQELDAMLEKEMEAKYGVCRDTARRARRDVLGGVEICRELHFGK